MWRELKNERKCEREEKKTHGTHMNRESEKRGWTNEQQKNIVCVSIAISTIIWKCKQTREVVNIFESCFNKTIKKKTEKQQQQQQRTRAGIEWTPGVFRQAISTLPLPIYLRLFVACCYIVAKTFPTYLACIRVKFVEPHSRIVWADSRFSRCNRWCNHNPWDWFSCNKSHYWYN